MPRNCLICGKRLNKFIIDEIAEVAVKKSNGNLYVCKGKCYDNWNNGGKKKFFCNVPPQKIKRSKSFKLRKSMMRLLDNEAIEHYGGVRSIAAEAIIKDFLKRFEITDKGMEKVYTTFSLSMELITKLKEIRAKYGFSAGMILKLAIFEKFIFGKQDEKLDSPPIKDNRSIGARKYELGRFIQEK